MPRTPDKGRKMLELMHELYPLCRSISGDGVRQTLSILQQTIPLTVNEVATGTPVLDWVVPKEWNIREAFVTDLAGNRLIDYEEHNLHVVSYSGPVDAEIDRTELLEHLHTLPNRPDWIPYRTSYYKDGWGFCLRHRDLARFTDDRYRVHIDSSLTDGHLTYGELVIPGRRECEVLFYSHLCHPSLANDNLSGIALTTILAEILASESREFTYRFVWAPGTIGSICWLARNEDAVDKIRHGLVAVLLGDRGKLTYKKSRQDSALIDEIAAHVVRKSGGRVVDFDPFGYDERQFCSPGFDLPVGRLTRTPHEEYPEYHTSADDMTLVSSESLDDSLAACLEIVEILENDAKYLNTAPKGEPQLGRRGLYRAMGGNRIPDRELALLWILNFSDGCHSLFDIARRSGLPFSDIHAAAQELISAQLLVAAEAHSP